MATVAPNAQVGGGVTSSSQSEAPIKVTSEALLTELKSIYAASKLQLPDSTFDSFSRQFCSPENNSVLPPPPLDLSHPLTSYFISSSHNTYLVDHQLYGSSTAQGYINVLNRACRCVEIDVWDGSDGEPKVDHGWTLTKDISFRVACEAIGEYGFVKSDLPIIVSLECHASIEQQEKMVNIMKSVWQGNLLDGELRGWDVATKGLPPPGMLKNKILVKVKHLPANAQPGGPVPQVQSLPGPASSSQGETLAEQARKLSLMAAAAAEELEEDESETDGKKKTPKVKISAALSALGVYASAMTFPESFTDAISRRPNHVFSFSEKKFNSLHEAQADALFQHNRHFLTRIYPHGLRVSSSNLDPQEFWRRGAQLVALNWQKIDRGMILNEAMFAGTGGYVLKPESHLPNTASSKSLADLERTVNLKITVLAGQSIPLPEGDEKPSGFKPYVKAVVYLAHSIKHKNKTKSGRGVDYAWGLTKGGMEFPKMVGVVESLAFVTFKIYDDELGKDSKAAWQCVRLDRLKPGYGFLKLIDLKGRQTNGVLLLKVDKTATPS
ncbi:hypothetical protein DRE_00935 [Drechslerella stenobrocha 248]|uniref:Phosphoinositide phospholipase C n=1 Tax=Drechslerella stenobrocha 248 TaxID=1043628 RepID=W7HLJ8_9PEZI|nr:hypothetical protein DRE_00935 [Drechslerella stenobrocha 248]